MGQNYAECQVLLKVSVNNGFSPGNDIFLNETNFLKSRPGGNLELGLDKVDSSDFFGHGVLHLDTRVNLDKVRPKLGVDQELDRSGILVLGS